MRLVSTEIELLHRPEMLQRTDSLDVETPMTTNDKEFDAKIGAAWKAHFAGQDQSAIDQFTKLAKQAPDNIDVHWGLGLAYRAVEDYSNALAQFENVRDLIATVIETEHGQLGRYFLLNRMAEQQIRILQDS